MNTRMMTFSALNSVLIKKQNSEEILSELTQKHRLSENDRKLFYAMTKGILKRKIFLDYIIRTSVKHQNFSEIDSKINNLLRLGLYQIIYMNSIPDYASVNEVVEICNQNYNKGLSGFVNAILRSFIRNRENLKLPDDSTAYYLSIKFSFPLYMIENWLNEYGKENTIKMCEYFNKPALLHLRFDANKISYEDFAIYLKEKNIEFSLSKFCPAILKLKSSFIFINDPFFQKGFYYIQDESTVLPIMLLNPQEGDNVLDLCAAPGGKTLLISSMMHNKGNVFANDINKRRMNLLKENAKRMNYNNIEFSQKDATTFSSNEKFDKILLDVPCTGLGTMQKKPEIRLQNISRLKSLIPLQKKILNNASRLVKNDGVIVYSTCTINKEENEKQIEKFLEFHDDFYIEKPDKFVEKSLAIDGYIKTYPYKHNMDGTFAVRLRKKEYEDS